jgi:hypothetical protein
MTKKAFVSNLISLGFQPEKYNTNNAWGFGGGIGTKYTKGNIFVRLGQAHFRHMHPQSYITVTVDGQRAVDCAPNKRGFEQALKVITPSAE